MENKKVANNTTLAIRPSAAAFFSKGKTIEPLTTPTAKAAPAMRPSAAAFFGQNKAIYSPVATMMKPNTKPEVFVDLSTLTNHSAITIVNNKSISIHIEMCGLTAEQTNMATLVAALPEYKSVKKLTLKIHAPWPKSESRETYNNRLSSIKKLFAIIDTFNLYTLKVIMSIDGLNFPQMKFGAAVHSLKFKKWVLLYQVYDEVKSVEGDVEKIFPGSEYDLRLRGVYKKEFLNSI